MTLVLTNHDKAIQLNGGGTATGAISGQVTAEAGGSSLQDISVCASGYSLYYCSTTNATGHYTINGLSTDVYKVSFYDPTNTYSYEYYNDQLFWSNADQVTVTDGQTRPNINAALSIPSHITGTVTDGA